MEYNVVPGDLLCIFPQLASAPKVLIAHGAGVEHSKPPPCSRGEVNVLYR
jgi:hypothetical protein